MGLQGNLKTIVLSDVLQWISTSRKTGILHIRGTQGITKRIFFRGGLICSTASSDPREYLGHFLISRGYLTEDQLNKAMETQIQTGIKLGKVLVMVGILEEEELVSMLRLKAEENLYGLFLWDEGEFTFEDLPDIDEDMIHMTLDVTSLIMEGIRRKDEWSRIRRVVRSDGVIFRKVRGKEKAAGSALKGFDQRAFALFDGSRSLAEAALELHATEFQISAAAYSLAERGFLEAAGEKEGAEEAAYTDIQRRLLDEAEKALEDRRFEEAVNLYKYLFKHLPEDEEVNRGLALAEEGSCQLFFKESVPLSSVLELAVPLEKLARENISPHEGFLASRVNGTWDIASILKVSPMAERQALKAIRKLLNKGILRVKSN